MARYTGVRAIPAEGQRVGFVTCTDCGATILLDPVDLFDPKALHDRFHEKFVELTHEATRYKPPPRYGGG